MRCRKGIAALEFAVVAPLLLLLLVSAADLGNALQLRQRLSAAAQAGAMHAAQQPADEAGIRAAVARMLPGWSDLSVTIPPLSCECPGSLGPVDCDAACAGGMQRFFSISLSVPFQPIFWKAISEVTADVVLRVQ